MIGILSGCGKDNDETTPKEKTVAEQIIGNWKYVRRVNPPYDYKISTPSYLTLKQDGTFLFKGETMTPWIDQNWDNLLETAVIDINGTYSFNEEGRKLIMTRPTWDKNGSSGTVKLYFTVSFNYDELVLSGGSGSYSEWKWYFKRE